MSKAFPVRASVKTRSQGANNNRFPSTNGASESGQGQGRGRTPTNSRGRGQVSGTGARSGGTSSTNIRMDHNSNRMNNSQLPGFGVDSTPQRSHRQDPQQESDRQQGQHASGFTVFQPNARRREQINQMAQRETQEYERFKKENSSKTYNYVGTTGGGQMSEDMVRRRQANDVRNQKFNRLQNQQRLREEKSAAEQREIDQKRSDARRKAEENASGGRTANPVEVRRKREAFLQRLENQQDQ